MNPMYSLLFATLLNTACGMPLLRRDPVDNSAGASGGDQGAYSLSTGGLVAIIVVIVLVVLLGSEFIIWRKEREELWLS